MQRALAVFLGAVVATSAEIDDATRLTNLHGSGTTNPSKYFWRVMGTLEERSRMPLHLTYRAVGSSTGQKEFAAETGGSDPAEDFKPFAKPFNDFGSGDIPMKGSYYKGMNDAGFKMLHVPFQLGAISFFFNIPGVDAIKLDNCALAQVFASKIKQWDDPVIVNLNPDIQALLKAAGAIKVVRRVYGSSSTQLMSTHLLDQCPDHFDIGAGSGDADPSDPSKPIANPMWREGTHPAQGSDGVANFITANEGSIGYLDAGHGHKLGLREVEMKNRDGFFLTSKTAVMGDAAKQDLPGPLDDWSSVTLSNRAGAKSWPIVAMSYIYLRQNSTHLGQAAGVLAAFVEYVLSEEGQALVSDYSFFPVPQNVLDISKAALMEFKGKISAGVPQWTFELPGTTQAIDGTGLYVFSGKRKDSFRYEISILEKQMADVMQRLAGRAALPGGPTTLPGGPTATRAEVAALRTQADNLRQLLDVVRKNAEETDSDTDSLKGQTTAALVVSVIAMVFGGIALALSVSIMKGTVQERASVEMQAKPVAKV